jgi:hypothetical protein
MKRGNLAPFTPFNGIEPFLTFHERKHTYLIKLPCNYKNLNIIAERRLTECLCNEIFTSNFIVFLKSTAGVMKNDVYSFIISHLILKLSHFIYFEL